MPNGSFFHLREQLNGILAQGLSLTAVDELDALAQQLSALQLAQPAALAQQIAQNIAARNSGQKDAEALVKILQTLAQAEIHLSDAESVNRGALTEIHGRKAVYAVLEAPTSATVGDLETILAIPNLFIRGHRLVEYLERADYENLIQSVEIAWRDYSLRPFIVEGLRERTEEAVELAQIAMRYKNLVVQRIALKVLETGGRATAFSQKIADLLREYLNKAKEPLKYHIMETLAAVESSYDDYLKAQRQQRQAHAAEVHQLRSPKKSERMKALKVLIKTKNPCFTDALIPTLEYPDVQVVAATMEGLLKIGGCDAIRHIAAKSQEQQFEYYANLILYQFGDRRGLDYFLSRKIQFPLEADVSFVDYGDLLLPSLFRMIKRIADPTPYQQGFFNLFHLLRYINIAPKIVQAVKKDALLAERLAALLQVVYPAQCQHILKSVSASAAFHPPEVIEELIAATLGETVNKLAATLKPKFLVYAVLVTPDAKSVLTLSANAEITVWDALKWKRQTSFTLKHVQYWTGYQIALSPDGQYLFATRPQLLNAAVWAFGQWQTPITFLEHTTETSAVAVTADNAYALVGGEQTVKVWEMGTWQEIAEFGGHSGTVEVIKSLPGQRQLVTGDRNGLIQVWEQGSWRKIADLKVNGIIANSVAVSPDGAYLAAVDTLANYLETKIRVWETETWKEVALLTIKSPTPIIALAFMPDSKYLLTGSDTVKFLEVGSWKEVLTLGNRDTRALAVMPDGKQIIAGQSVWQVDLKF